MYGILLVPTTIEHFQLHFSVIYNLPIKYKLSRNLFTYHSPPVRVIEAGGFEFPSRFTSLLFLPGETLRVELLLANAGRVRRAVLNGREYLVAPLTLIVHGVLNGSKGSLYYPLGEIGREPEVWNHIPIVVYHPTINGENVSAKDPGVLENTGIGILRNSRVDKDRLRAEGWFDVERTRRIDPRVLNALENNRSIELSTGLYTENEPAPLGANYRGIGYEFIARNYKPDHLAILPDQVGACSIRDGCGVLVNSSSTVRTYRTASGKILLVDNSNPEGCNQYGCSGEGKGKSGGGSRKYGKASRAGTPNAIPESGHYPHVEKVESEPPKSKSKRSSKVVEDHPEAVKIADESYKRHQERVKDSKDIDLHQESLEQHKKELEDAGIVPTHTGYGFKKGRGPTGNKSSKQSHILTKYKEVGDWLSKHGLMPGYGQIYIRGVSNNREAWYVGGDGDERDFGKLVEKKLKELGVSKVRYEAETFPPKNEGWIQVYPSHKSRVGNQVDRPVLGLNTGNQLSSNRHSTHPSIFSPGDLVGVVSLKPSTIIHDSRLERFVGWLTTNAFLQPRAGGGQFGGSGGSPAPSAAPTGPSPLLQAYLQQTLEASGVSVDKGDRNPLGKEESDEDDDEEESKKSSKGKGVKTHNADSEQPSDYIPSSKACTILHDKEVRGHPLTDQQRKMFGAACKGSKGEGNSNNTVETNANPEGCNQYKSCAEKAEVASKQAHQSGDVDLHRTAAQLHRAAAQFQNVKRTAKAVEQAKYHRDKANEHEVAALRGGKSVITKGREDLPISPVSKPTSKVSTGMVGTVSSSMKGHVFEGMSKEEMGRSLGKEVGKMMDGESDVRGYEKSGPPKSLNMSKFKADVAKVIQDNVKEKGTGATIEKVYDKVGREHGLNISDFHKSLVAMHNSDDPAFSKSGAYPRGVQDHPHPELLLPYKTKFYGSIQPGNSEALNRHASRSTLTSNREFINRGKSVSTLERFIDWLTGSPAVPAPVLSVTENAGVDQPRHGDTGQYLPHGSGTGKGGVHQAAIEGSRHNTGHEQALENDADDDEDSDEEGEIGQGDRGSEKVDLEETITPGYNPIGVGKGRVSTVTNKELEQVSIVYNRDWPQSKRDKLDSDDFAGPDQSFPITKQEDVDSAAKLVDKADNPEAVKRKIIKIAKRKGLSIPESWKSNKNTTDNEGSVSSTTDNQDPNTSDSYGNMEHEASKNATAATVRSESPKARDHALAALDHSGNDNSEDAADSHIRAAKVHENVATKMRKDGQHAVAEEHDRAAALHRKAASMHSASMTNNKGDGRSNSSNTITNVDTPTEEEVKEASGAAKGMSKRANQEGTVSLHKAAADAHDKAADMHRKFGNDKKADYHDSQAASHKMSAKLSNNRGNTMTREQILNTLTVNCTCEEDRMALNGLSDETLVAVYNAKAEGSNADVIGKKGYQQVGGKGNVEEYNENAVDDDVDGDPDDDDDGEIEPPRSKPGKYVKGMKQMTENQYLAMAPPRLQRVLKDALEIEARERGHLVKRLTANISNPNARNKLITRLSKKPLEELRELISLVPAVRNTRRETVSEPALYLGAAGGAENTLVDNASDDVLPLPSLSFGKEGA